MKYITYLFLGIYLALPQLATAEQYSCAEKRIAVETKIKNAQQYNDYYQIRGLKQALTEIENNCNDVDFSTKVNKEIRKLEQKIQKQNHKVTEIKNDLQDAQNAGDLSKQSKYQKKLIEQQSELDKLNSELQQLKQRA
jgi:septation ring formation regulator EzrA